MHELPGRGKVVGGSIDRGLRLVWAGRSCICLGQGAEVGGGPMVLSPGDECRSGCMKLGSGLDASLCVCVRESGGRCYRCILFPPQITSDVLLGLRDSVDRGQCGRVGLRFGRDSTNVVGGRLTWTLGYKS